MFTAYLGEPRVSLEDLPEHLGGAGRDELQVPAGEHGFDRRQRGCTVVPRQFQVLGEQQDVARGADLSEYSLQS
jgi:hypothetical protein